MNTAVTSMPLTPAGDARASAGARLRHRFGQAASRLWKAIEASGQARAHRHLMEFASQCEALQPELAKELRAATRHGPLA